MTPNQKRETARIALWALAAMTLAAIYGEMIWTRPA